jgi:hypothetical protein
MELEQQDSLLTEIILIQILTLDGAGAARWTRHIPRRCFQPGIRISDQNHPFIP